MAYSWSPSIEDVADILRSRTKNTSGQELGTFTADTHPQGDQVVSLINKAINDVWLEIGDIPDPADVVDVTDKAIATRLNAAAKNVVIIRAAMLVELSYFSDQINTGRSTYPQLLAMYSGNSTPGSRGALQSLVEAVEEFNTTGNAQAGDDILPDFAFPCNDPVTFNPNLIQSDGFAQPAFGRMIGFGTRW